MTLDRTNNNTAVLTATGSLDQAVTAGTEFNFLNASATVGNTGLDGKSGNFTLGGVATGNVFISGGTNYLTLFFASNLAAGAVPAGSLTITLNVETWSPVGTTGNIQLGSNAQAVVGTYTITGAASGVPEPGSLGMLGTGLAGLLFAARKLRR